MSRSSRWCRSGNGSVTDDSGRARTSTLSTRPGDQEVDRDSGRGTHRTHRRARALGRPLRAPSMARRRHLGRHLRPPDRAERRVPRQADQRLQDPRLGHAEGDRPDHREVRRAEGRGPARRASPRRRAAARHARSDAAAIQKMLAAGPPRSRRSTRSRADVVGDHEPARRRARASSRQTAGSRTSTCSTTRPASSCRAADVVGLEDQLRSIGAARRAAGRVHG